MPVRYEVSADGEFVRATATGELTPEDINGYIEAVAQDSRVRPGFSEMFDVRLIASSSVPADSFAEMHRLAMENPKRRPRSKVAIVVGSTNSMDKARQYESIASPDVQNVIVFTDLHTAETWLGVTGVNTGP